MVQKICMFLCRKIGSEVGKVLNRDKEGNVANQMARHHKDTENGCFGVLI